MRRRGKVREEKRKDEKKRMLGSRAITSRCFGKKIARVYPSVLSERRKSTLDRARIG